MTDDKQARAMGRLLLVAALLALANGLWSVFLWQQLLVARAGGEAFCALGGEGCAALWDGAFASVTHAYTGLPVAAWGLLWSVVALLVAVFARQRAAVGADAEPFFSATALCAAAGVLSILGLLAVSLAEGGFCSNCAITYLLVAAYAGCVFVASGARRPASLGRGLAWSAGLAVASFALLLYPGLATPRAGAVPGARALAEVSAQTPDGAPAGSAAGGEGVERVQRLLASLPEAERQYVANARARYADATPVAVGEPRALIGPADAPVRITTFTDSGCSHCATFHKGLEQLLGAVPPGSVAVDQRVFPLDGSCNPVIDGGGRSQVCLAAKVRVCLEGDPRALELSGWLHEDAAPLRPESIYEVAERLAPRSRIEACVASPETQAHIDADVALAMQAGLRGTPFVLVNGRPAMTYIPFLYALVLTGGDVSHPVYAGLPSPQDPEAGHEGHDH